MSYVIEAHNLKKTFDDKQALQNISLSITPDKITGIVGPDGAGKTTLIRLMAGLLLPTNGEIITLGYEMPKQASEVSPLLGYMPQRFGLYEELTVKQNMDLYADLKGLPFKERKSKFAELLDLTGLFPFQQRRAGALSGGMKQKLGLACALIKRPKLLLLDEPSVGVDPISRKELWKMIRGLVEQKITAILSTAYLDEAASCDEVLLLNNGHSLFFGEPKKMTERVHDRVFLIVGIMRNRRDLLSKLITEGHVSDGVIQGSAIRLVLKKGKTPDSLNSFLEGNEKIIPASPRFEDAFIDELGGIPEENAPLAQNVARIPQDNKIVVETKHLVKKYGSFTAVDDISFKIKRGEIFGLLGPNGAGKSTTFKMMCGLVSPTSGTAIVAGYDLRHSSSLARSKIGYMAQKFSLYGNLSVRQNLEFFSGIYNLKGEMRREKIKDMIEIFSFEPYLRLNADELSLGYKQRLALACSLMHSPEILFLDEPTSGVDPLTRREFWDHINGLVDKGVTILVTTHFMDEAEYCDRIGLIYRGKMIESGTPEELKEIAANKGIKSPTLEDAFITLVEGYDARDE